MKKSSYFKSSLIVAVSGLAASAGHAAVVSIGYDVTVVGEAGGDLAFDITGDAVDDYKALFAGESKPQINNFGGGINQIFLNTINDDDHNTLPVLVEGMVVGPDLAVTLGGVMADQGFFYENWNSNLWGDWGGTPAGANPPDPVVGPISGYVGLAIPTDGTLTDFNYGYAHFTVDVTQGVNNSITLLATGYETELNTPITIVPEPSVAALVAGALGVMGLRLRRARR